MVTATELIKASLGAGRGLLRGSLAREFEEHGAGTPPVIVPIRSLGPRHRDRIATHLLSLDESDRYLRFGYAASDEQVRAYVDHLDFERDDIFGIYNRHLVLIAVAHLAIASDPSCDACAEFGVSVLKSARGRGFGARLFDRAVMHARNAKVDLLFIHALSENTAMLAIARKAGAAVERHGPESDAYLKLPPADFDSRMTEIVEEHFAQTDYRLKVQAKHFTDFLAGLQEIRRSMAEARGRSGS